MTDETLPPALREARDRIAAKIKERMPGCSLPDCHACRNNQREAEAMTGEAMAAALRWAHHMPKVCLLHAGCRDCDAIAALEREAGS